MTDPLRYGLVGTGTWARAVHLPGAAAAEVVRPAAVLGRNLDRADALAATVPGMRGFTDVDEFLREVDIVAFAVAPEVQVDLAIRAARAGKPVLLEKPVATTATAARDLEREIGAAGVPSIVFFTALLSPDWAEWIAGLGRRDDLWFVQTRSLSTLMRDPGDPFHDSPWRHQRGALWDIAPHDLALAVIALGPVAEVSATRGPGDLTIVSTRHAAGERASLTVALDAPIGDSSKALFGAGPREEPPEIPDWNASALAAVSTALVALVERVHDPAPHPLDIRLGTHVVEVLAAAEASVSSGRSVAVPL